MFLARNDFVVHEVIVETKDLIINEFEDSFYIGNDFFSIELVNDFYFTP